MTRSSNNPKPPPLLDRHARRWMGFGIEFGGVVGLFTWGGMSADDFYGTSPWLTVTGALFSLTGMIYLMLKEVLSSNGPNDRDRFF